MSMRMSDRDFIQFNISKLQGFTSENVWAGWHPNLYVINVSRDYIPKVLKMAGWESYVYDSSTNRWYGNSDVRMAIPRVDDHADGRTHRAKVLAAAKPDIGEDAIHWVTGQELRSIINHGGWVQHVAATLKGGVPC